MSTLPETEQWVKDLERQRADLYFALRSRALTDEEMRQVQALDFHITIPASGCSYREGEKLAEFNAALLQQFKLRLEAERAEIRAHCHHPDQRLLVTVGKKLLYQCEKCEYVVVSQLE